MGLLTWIDTELQKDLINFIKTQEEDRSQHTLGDHLIVELLKEIISGNARMSGCATNHATKKMYLELSFFEETAESDAAKGVDAISKSQAITEEDIIQELRDLAGVEGPGGYKRLLEAAADRIEELSERVAIMSVEKEAEEAQDERMQVLRGG